MHINISTADKLSLMSHVLFLLNIVDSNVRFGITPDNINKVFSQNDVFLSICYRITVTAQNPFYFKPMLDNFIRSESNALIRIKMMIQKDAILALKQPNALHLANFAIMSHFGLSFNDIYMRKLKELDESMYRQLFIDGRFQFLEIDINQLGEFLDYIKNLDYDPSMV